MPLKLIGKACPIGIANSYNETFAPGALDGFLKETKSLPMMLMHDQGQVGTWDSLHLSDWLYCSGVCDHPETERNIKNGSLAELSIAYTDLDTEDKIGPDRNKLSREEYYQRAKGSRTVRQLDAASDFLKKIDPLDAILIMADIASCTKAEQRIALEAMAKKSGVLAPLLIKRATIGEISIVNGGSFADTSIHWQEI